MVQFMYMKDYYVETTEDKDVPALENGTDDAILSEGTGYIFVGIALLFDSD